MTSLPFESAAVDVPTTGSATTSRPRVLVAALAASATVAVLTLLSQVLVLAGGQDGARDAVLAELPADASAFPDLVETAVAQAYDTLQARAWTGIVAAVLVLLLTAAAMRAGRVARVALVVMLAVSALLMLRSVTDVFPSGSQALGVAAALLTPVAVVLLFLPPVGRYRAARHRS